LRLGEPLTLALSRRERGLIEGVIESCTDLSYRVELRF